MSCAVDQKIEWSHIKDIADRIDDLAATLGTPDYEKLVDVEDMPFKFSSLPTFTGAIHFYLNSGTNVVWQQFLSTGTTTGNPFPLDEVLDLMGQTNDLYLVLEEDDCWCTTIFKVDTVTTGDPIVKKVPDMGCCQSIFIPQEGDPLNDEQYVIPDNYVSAYVAAGAPGTDEWITLPACEASTQMIGFRFVPAEIGSPLHSCSRGNLSGYFTWPMRKKYMDKMIEKLEFILECANSGGAVANQIRVESTSGPEYLPEGCRTTVCALAIDQEIRGNISTSEPGCIIEGCDSSVEASEVPDYPWESPTCGGEDCDTNGPKFYCRILEDLEFILTAAESGVRPLSGTAKCSECNCVAEFEGETQFGYAEWCILEYVGIGWVTGFHVTRFYEDFFEGGTCIEIDQREFVDAIIDCDAFPCENVLVVEDTHCQDDEEHSYSPTLFNDFAPPFITAGGPPWGALEAAASSCYDSSTPSIGLSSSFSSYATTTLNPESPVTQSAQAETAGGRFRMRIVGSWTCATPPPSITLTLKKTVALDGADPVITEQSVTLTWDSGEMTLLSGWITVDPPDWPATRPGGSHISYELKDTIIKCPAQCTSV